MSDDSEGVAVSIIRKDGSSEPKQLPCGGIDPAIFTKMMTDRRIITGDSCFYGVKLNRI